MMKTALVLALTLSVGCASKPPAASADNAPASTPSAAAAQATAQPAIPRSGVQTVTGTVLETMDAASYTYVRVKGDAGEIWAASLQFKVAVGDRVVVPLETPMSDFRSESLKRVFPLIYFASRITREGEPAVPVMAASHATTGMGQMAPGAGAPVAAVTAVTEPIAPAPDGLTIADVWAKRVSLAGKTMTVRGKVVKFNGGILGRNWLHIQDGSGKAADATHDLTITTDAVVKIGDVVTAKGVLAIDKAFSAGYAYKAILESAIVVVK
jgi:hypothetical protein